MPTKEAQLLQQLREKTEARAIPWEPTANQNEFVATFRGEVSFTVSRVYDSFYSDVLFQLVMRDRENREMLSLDSRRNPDLREELAVLYQTAHNAALKVEETLDSILEDLRKVG